MSWLRLDDRTLEHPKVVALSDAAFRLWFAALCWALRGNSMERPAHGFVTETVAVQLGATHERIAELTQIVPGEKKPLWEPEAGGWQIHDFEQYIGPMTHAERQARYRSSRSTGSSVVNFPGRR